MSPHPTRKHLRLRSSGRLPRARMASVVVLGGLLAAVAGRGAPGERLAPASGPDTSLVRAMRPRVMVMGSFAPAGVETVQAVSPEPAAAEPTADYPSLEVTRDSLEALVRRTVAPGDTAIHIRRERVMFEYAYARAKARGWAIHVDVNDTSACPNSALQDALTAAGWIEDYAYMADGTDGSNSGFLSRRALCVINAHWDGGDDSDSTVVPAPGCTVIVTCVPRRKDDVAPR